MVKDNNSFSSNKRLLSDYLCSISVLKRFELLDFESICGASDIHIHHSLRHG